MHYEDMVMLGTCHVVLRDPCGRVKAEGYHSNLITDAGDLYYATMAIAGVSPSNTSAPTKVTGMKLGTGTTAAAKNGAGSAIVTYITGSGQVFDATYPKVNNLGAGSGVQAVYQVTYPAGTATSSAISEVSIVNDAATNNTNGSVAANTISRVLFGTPYNKGSLDTLAIDWTHLFLGS